MEWSRRAFGVVLSAALLHAIALPALCGKCQARAANSDCTEGHGGKAKQPGESSAGYADCDHCDEAPGISANRPTNPGALEILIVLPDSPSTELHDSMTSATSPTSSVDGAIRKYIFAVEIHPPPEPRYRPLTVSLKI